MSVLGEPIAEVFFALNQSSRSVEMKEATMVHVMLIQLARARTDVVRTGRAAERLRRSGYADGERRPRITRHWTNR